MVDLAAVLGLQTAAHVREGLAWYLFLAFVSRPCCLSAAALPLTGCSLLP